MSKIKVTITPASGAPQEIELDATGVTLGELKAKAGIAAGMNATINGNSASDNDHVPDGATVRLTERVRGS